MPKIKSLNPKSNSLDTEGRFIVYVGNLGSEMLGLQKLIRLYNHIWEVTRVKFIIVGNGVIKEDLVSLVDKLNMKEAIKFTGFINHDKVLEYVKFSELCVIPYLDTPLTKVSTPTKMFEYISIGKVVVCPNYGGFSEILGKKTMDFIQTIMNMILLKKLITYYQILN